MERAFKKKEEENVKNLHAMQNEVMEIKQKNDGLERIVKNMQGTTDLTQKNIELTKQNAILDVNLLKLSRKYQCLEEQWKLLYREYHSKDNDIADKDVAMMYRIQKLQEWKSNAI